MNELFEVFCENSSLHGLHYLVNKRKALPERIFWSVLLTTTIFILVTEIFFQLNVLYSSTVLAVVENPHYDLSASEFPAITVCPNINVMNSKVQSLMKSSNLSEMSHSSFKNSLIALSLMRFAYFNLPQDYVSAINGNVYPIKNEEIKRKMYEVKPDLDTIMDSCTLRHKHIDCKVLFQVQLTLEGFCYSFNSKTAIKSTQDLTEIYPLENPNKTLIGFKTSMFGVGSGLGFRLKSLTHETLNKSIFGDYYSVIVHSPLLTPDLNKMFVIPSNEPFYRNYIAISVSVIEADKSLRYMKESLRGCHFINGSKVFTCSLECKILKIMKICHCLPYNLHHLVLESKICGLEHLKCLNYIAGFLRTYGVPKGTLGFPDWIRSWDTPCSCLQPCSYVAYAPQLRKEQKQSISIDGGWARVDIFYDRFAVKYSRTASYLYRDFLVNLGSFANLLLGLSSVAIVDLIMHCFKCFKMAYITLSSKRNTTKITRKANKI